MPLDVWALAMLSLAVAFVIALTQPGASRPPPDAPTFVAFNLTVLACALELAAMAHRLVARPAGWLRVVVGSLAFIGVLAAGWWLIGRAPGREVLLGWIIGPAAIGVGAVVAGGRRGSWTAVGFAAVAVVLVAFLGARWIGV
jgi:hypothetical protein